MAVAAVVAEVAVAALTFVSPAPLPVKLFEALLKVTALLYVPLMRPVGTVPLDRLLAFREVSPAPLPVKLLEALLNVNALV